MDNRNRWIEYYIDVADGHFFMIVEHALRIVLLRHRDEIPEHLYYHYEWKIAMYTREFIHDRYLMRINNKVWKLGFDRAIKKIKEEVRKKLIREEKGQVMAP